ncbi:hypothetical protein AB0K52_22005 [Glycomyces sp. NPDC049804]|uniref:hypothetical protein n=1 Tax=Glycomyces sp. NPDC049804 TaxID=3154363 RepID=UPI00342A25AE
MRIYLDEDGDVAIDYDDKRFVEFGAFLKLDVNYSMVRCLDALQMVADVDSGISAVEVYDGEVHRAEFRREGVLVTHKFLPERTAQVPFDVAVRALEQFWTVIESKPVSPNRTRVYRPDLPLVESELHLWESTWHRPHPYRGRLGIPTGGEAV